MTVNLELRPEIEAQLVAQANARGLSLKDYLKRLVELTAGVPAVVSSVQTMSYDEWERGFEALIDSFPQQNVLSDDSISRDSIYTREDEI